ncbi:MAG: hypothetical protein ACRC5C_03670, partial [Bacilli bacterium]
MFLTQRVRELLLLADEQATRYPYSISFKSMVAGRTIYYKKKDNDIYYFDVDREVQKSLKRARFQYSDNVMESPLQYDLPPVTQAYLSKSYSEAIKGTDYFLICELKSVSSGHKIEATALYRGERSIQAGILEKQRMDIRLNGIRTVLEKSDDGEEKAFQIGLKKKYGVSDDELKALGKEAREKVAFLLRQKEKRLVIVRLVAHKQNPLQVITMEDGSYVADIFATNYYRVEDVLKYVVEKGDVANNVGKTLLVTTSKNKKTKLAEHYKVTSSDTTSNTDGWENELNGGSTTKPGGPTDGIYPHEGFIEIKESEEYVSNANDFVVAYDDRQEQFFKGITSTKELEYSGRTRIGDIMLTVPPTSIEVSKETNIAQRKGIRTKSSTFVHSGRTLTKLTLNLYFHDEQAINGKPIARKKGSDEVFYVDGLRPLLAQMSKIPFVPIDNYFINERLGIHDVAILDVDIQTVPNFPRSLMAQITMVEFNVDAYIQDQKGLQGNINYPLMRWFYNKSMEPNSDGTHFAEMAFDDYSSLKFELANEFHLQEIKSSLEFVRINKSPTEYRINKEKEEGIRGIYEDAKNLREINDQMLRWTLHHEKYGKKKTAVRGPEEITGSNDYSLLAYPQKISPGPSSDSGANNSGNGVSVGIGITEDDVIKEVKSAFGWTDSEARLAVATAPQVSNIIYNGEYPTNSSLYSVQGGLANSVFFSPYSPIRFKLNVRRAFIADTKLAGAIDKDVYKGALENGLIHFFPQSDYAKKVLSGQYFEKFKMSTGVYLIPAKDSRFNGFIKDILKKVALHDDDINSYEAMFEEHLRVIDAGESAIEMDEYKIEGFFKPLDINVSSGNQYSMIHTLQSAAPTLQYIGGGDRMVRVTAEADADAVQSLSQLGQLSDMYVREYRQGMALGFLNIKNNMCSLMGIQSVMVTGMNVKTVEGFPNRFIVTFNAVAFDKTQRQRERLRKLAGNTENITKDELVAYKIDYANDRLMNYRMRELE